MMLFINYVDRQSLKRGSEISDNACRYRCLGFTSQCSLYKCWNVRTSSVVTPLGRDLPVNVMEGKAGRAELASPKYC